MPDPIEEAAAAAVVPVREQRVDFYGDELAAGELADGTVLVPLRPICDALGLSWPAQTRRVERDPALAAGRTIAVMATVQGPRDMLCLPLKLLPGWLFGISSARVRPELRDKIVRYQQDAYEVLWNAFKADILPPGTPAPLPAGELTGAALAYEIGTAIQTLARQQLDLEARVGDVVGRQDALAAVLRPFIEATGRELAAHATRLTALELQSSAGATMSEAQAAEIALAVKNVGQALAARGDRTGYARVYSEMYRRFRVSSYKSLPTARFQEVLDWLSGWYDELGPPTGQNPGSTP